MKTAVLTKNRLDDFLDFPERLYEGDQKYTPFMRAELKKNLIRLLFEEKSYTGLMTTDDTGRICGRLIFTIDKNKQLKTDRCGFFYLYECVNDPHVSHDLLSMLETMLRQQGAEYISGPYWPFDRDNRRGFLFDFLR